MLNQEQREWLEKCPPGETRSITIDGCEYKVSRAWSLPFVGFEEIRGLPLGEPMVTLPETPIDNARTPEPWEQTQGVSGFHRCPVDDCCRR